MNILLYHPVKENRDIIAFCLETELGIKVKPAASFQEAIDLFLEEDAIDLVITIQQPENEKLFKYMLSTSMSIPMILIGEEEKSNLEAFPDIDIIGYVKEGEIQVQGGSRWLELIRKKFKDLTASLPNEEFCRISTELLVRVVPLRGDIYIRLSSVKFVKLFRNGAVFTQEDLEKYFVRRKIPFLYMKRSESVEFVEKFRKDLVNLVEAASPGDAQLFETVNAVQELIQELTQRLGFTNEVQQIAKDNVKLTLKAIGDSLSLTKALAASQLSSKNYISAHSILLANIACSIAAQMKWPSATTFHKIVIASLFHDIVFTSTDLCSIQNLKQLESVRTKISEADYNLVRNHPTLSAERIKSLTEVPGEVEFVINQHHERPDGSGFPLGLKAHQIAPLAAVFICAHDLVDSIIFEGKNFSLATFLKKYAEEYNGGAFKTIWKTLSSSNET